MAKTKLIMVATVAAAAVAGIVAWYGSQSVSPAEKLAKLPAAEQNVIIFDAAVALLKANYHDPALFEKPEWAKYETEWREKAAKSQSGLMLYMNVLKDFGSHFADSHLSFEVPAPPTPAASADKPPTDPAVAARFARNFALMQAGPGFDVATLRRAGRATSLVADVLQGSPAERAGVTPGWALQVWKIDLNQEGVRYEATFIPLTPEMAREVERTGLPFAATTQQQIDEFVASHSLDLKFAYEQLAPRVDFEARELADGVIYLRIDHFNDMTLVGRALDVIDSAGPAGLVLDLRRNAGGLMLHMTRVNGRLLGDDVELGTLRGRDSVEPMFSLKLGDGHYKGPLAVLIGPSSSSAAEITAAAVQDHKRGRLIGRMTNGSVVSGMKYALPDGGTMMIPVKDFRRSSGQRIEGVGVEPDIWVLPTLEDVRAGRDPVLERAIATLRQ